MPFQGHPEIVKWPDPSLCSASLPADPADPSLPALAARLLRIMAESGGAGLAAVQIGVPVRVAAFAASCLPPGTPDTVLANPVATPVCGFPAEDAEEGCLSLPGVRASVARPSRVVLTGTSIPSGESFRATLDGFGARCALHETGHLDGTVFPMLLPPLKKRMLLDKYAKGRKAEGRKRKPGR